ncbi:thermonuclease family protein [Mesorhizobium sp. ANAO-SY3R2]|uniref:thermonuclease family protein n=1 Tax=Mesorhizobium sp. ANAO-SY3R2 TaxID=3166644 RepID=UPI0036720F09
MKPSALAFAAAGFGVAVLIVSAGGSRLSSAETPVIDVIDESEILGMEPEGSDMDGTETAEPSQLEEQVVDPVVARAVAPDEIVPPAIEQDGLVREAPRAPLSELSLALPPKPKVTDEWDGTALFQPVAAAAGVIESKGLSVAIAGVTPLDAGESCSFEDKEWNCGARARTAFRGLLRGRAVVCALPAEAGQGDVVARCRIGKQDVGEWLVSNGWARAEAGGPYEDVGNKAEAEKKGIFGPPPERIEMTLSPDAALPGVEGGLSESVPDMPVQ